LSGGGSAAPGESGGVFRRELAVAARIQAGLERVYCIDRVADVEDFVAPADEGGRESLLLRQAESGHVEMRLQLPALPATGDGVAPLDAVCQIIEGVSHFVYVAERARVDRETTQLELELQAEVDKWVVLAASMPGFDAERSAALRANLYERVVLVHDETTELGERYRVANDVAHRFVRHLERAYVRPGRFAELRAKLRTFFTLGQEEKLRLGRAA
jgi:hypothetical protein